MIPIKDTIHRIGFPAVTWALITINGIIFLFELTLPKDILLNAFYLFGLVPARYSYPQWALIHGLRPDDYLSFVTNMFLHGGWLHILSNMWFLYLFGRTVEDRMGHLRFLIFYLLSGIAANVIYFLIDIHSKIPEFGASGAIAGVMGAYVVMYPTARIVTLIFIFFFPLFVEVSAFFFVGFWFLMQLISGTLSLKFQGTGGVAWWAHVGGFVSGVLLSFVFRKKPSRKRQPDEAYHYVNR